MSVCRPYEGAAEKVLADVSCGELWAERHRRQPQVDAETDRSTRILQAWTDTETHRFARICDYGLEWLWRG